MSYEAALRWFDIANGVLVLALIAGVVATYVIYITGNIKEDYVKEKLSESHDRSAKLEDEAAKSRERTAILEKGNIELQTNLEKERRARLEIETRLAPRHLTAQQTSTISSAIRAFGKPMTIAAHMTGDAEAGPYAEGVIKAFMAGGAVVHISNFGMMSPPVYGIVLRIKGLDDPGGAAIKGALDKAAVPYKLSVEKGITIDAYLTIGLKFPP